MDNTTQLTTKWIKVIKYIAASLLLLVSCCAKFLSFPFGSGVLAGLVICGFNIVYLAPIYIVGSMIAEFSWYHLISSGSFLLVMLLFSLLLSKRKMSLHVWAAITLAATIVESYIMHITMYKLLDILLNIVFVLITAYITVGFVRPIESGRMKYKLLETELACGGMLIVIMGMGLISLESSYFSLFAMVSSLAILCSLKMSTVGATMVIAVCLGVGAGISSYSLTLASGLVIVASISAVFRHSPRVITAISVLFGYVIIAYYFDGKVTSVGFLIGLALGGLCYVLLPKAFIKLGYGLLSTSHTRTAMKHLVNLNRKELSNRLEGTARVYDNMNRILNSMSSPDSDATVAQLAGRLEETVCDRCDNKIICSTINGYRQSLYEIMDASDKRGKATLVDVSTNLADSCIKITFLLHSATELVEATKKATSMKRVENESKLAVASQLTGVSRVLSGLAVKIAAPVGSDSNIEKNILEELTLADIVCSEAILSEGEKSYISMIVRSDTIKKNIIAKVLSRVVKHKMTISSVVSSVLAGWSIVYAVSAVKYDVVYGIAGRAKHNSTISGDTHSFVRLEGDKVLMVLCDGMGSGEGANRVSSEAISLIETFYCAGYDSELVLESVNHFLSMSSEEVYSAMDICVFDLAKGSCDLIKVGSPPSFIRGKDTTEVINGCALPMGIVAEMRPHVTTRHLDSPDMIAIVTDGIADVVSIDQLQAVINNSSSVAPQEVADNIIKLALMNSKGLPSDDMSVAVMRVFVDN